MNFDFWNIRRSKSVQKLFSRMIVFVTFLTTLLVGVIFINHEITTYQKIEQLQRDNYISEQKQFIKDLVKSEVFYIKNRKFSLEQEKLKELKFNVEQVHEVASRVYNDMGKYPASEKQALLLKLIEYLKSENHFRKVFIGSMSGEGVFYEGQPNFENANLLKLTDIDGNPVVKNELEFLKNNKEGFLYYNIKDSIDQSLISDKKVVYLKKFTPYNWYFGCKMYFSDYLDSFKKEIAEKISSLRLRHSGYVFINHINGSPIVMDGQVYQGKFNFFDGTDPNRQQTFLKELEAAKSSDEGGYFTYEWNKINETKLSPKLSYAMLISELNWVVGAGFYLDDIDMVLLAQKDELKKGLIKSLLQIAVVLLFVLLFETLMIYFLDKRYKSDFNLYFKFIEKASEDYQKTDNQIFYFEEFQKSSEAVNKMIDKHEETHQKLVQEQEKATRSDKLKTAFLANMSHEIRTPMNAIVGFSELLSKPDNEILNKPDMLHHITTNSRQLLKLIDDIVDIAKIESNQLQINRRNVDLNRLLKNVTSEINSLIILKKNDKITFATEFNIPDHFILSTDESRLTQVLLNLLDNAVKFTDEGFINLSVALNEEGIRFSVKDSGIGISPEEQILIFERFRRSDQIHNYQYRGTGLGLSISKKIVELFGGELLVKSSVSKGSEFYFTLPV